MAAKAKRKTKAKAKRKRAPAAKRNGAARLRKGDGPRRGRVRLADIEPAPYNPRIISEKALAGLGASLDRFGLVQPIVVNVRTNRIVGGHQRAKALEAKGVKMADAVLVDLNERDEKALNLALNSGEISGEWTAGALPLIDDLLAASPELSGDLLLADLKVTLDRAFPKADDGAGEETKDVPPPPKRPKTKLGDCWLLGDHRLVCGDSTDPDAVALAMGGKLADLVFTDPPYGVEYESPSGEFDAIAGDNLQRDDLVALLKGAIGMAVRYAQDEAAFYVWHASVTRDDFSFALKAIGLEERQYLVWAKPAFVMGRADYQWSHEPCFYSCKAGHSPKWHGDRTQQTVWRVELGTIEAMSVVLGPGLVLSDGEGHELTLLAKTPKRKLRSLRAKVGQTVQVYGEANDGSLWEVSRDPGKPVHPTQKPSALAARAMRNSTADGGHVLDVFAGAGGVVVAAEQLGRIAHMVELDPRYCDVIVKRWENLTERKAKRGG